MEAEFTGNKMNWLNIREPRVWAVLWLAISVFFLFADQNLMAPNLSAIANDFGFDEDEKDRYLGSYVSIGFFIVGGPAALIVGYLTDILHRPRLFGYVIFLGEASCFGTYWVTTFVQLLMCRVLTGIAVGGATPIVGSMLADLFPAEQRTYAATLVTLATGAGVGIGQLFSG